MLTEEDKAALIAAQSGAPEAKQEESGLPEVTPPLRTDDPSHNSYVSLDGKQEAPLDRKNCPVCFWNLDNTIPLPSVSEIDKVNYLKSLLFGVPFVKTYSLLSGVFTVEVRTLFADELQLVERATLERGKDDLYYQQNQSALAAEMLQWHTALSVKSLLIKGKTITFPDCIHKSLGFSPDEKYWLSSEHTPQTEDIRIIYGKFREKTNNGNLIPFVARVMSSFNHLRNYLDHVLQSIPGGVHSDFFRQAASAL